MNTTIALQICVIVNSLSIGVLWLAINKHLECKHKFMTGEFGTWSFRCKKCGMLYGQMLDGEH